jgi:hypothetical protein
VPVGYTTHDIRPRGDLNSSINVANRVSTCSNQGGIQACHPSATIGFATGRVHAYGTKAQIAAGFRDTHIEGLDTTRLVERAQKDYSNEELFKLKILTYIRWFYKLFIPMVIGFMVYHQWMDFLSIRRERKKARKGK